MPRQSLPDKDTAHVRRMYLLRRELLVLAPFSMATIDRLEARGVFPRRIRLEPTNRVAWSRSEVERFLNQYAKRRPGSSALTTAQKDNAA